MSQAPRGASGVTLLELIVVIAIVATVTVFALPSIRRGSDGLQLRAGAARVASLLREARQQAVTHRRATRVTLETNGRVAALTWDGTGEPLRRVDLPDRFRVQATAGGDALTFSARGLVRNARWVVEGPGGRRLFLEILGMTGRVVVSAAP